jgi:hypothetical protein
MDEIFRDQFQKEIGPILESVNAKKTDRIHNWINPAFLYYLNDSLWFSCSYDWKDHKLGVNLGRLFLFNDCLPRLVVLEEYRFFLDELCNKGCIKKKELKRFDLLPDGVNLIAKTLMNILSDYVQLSYAIQEKTEQKYQRIKPYLVKEIINIEMLFRIWHSTVD